MFYKVNQKIKTIGFFLIILTFTIASCENLTTDSNNKDVVNKNLKYPNSLRDSSYRDDFFGKTIYDPYQYLESSSSKITKDWVAAQNNLTYSYLDKIPFRGKIIDRLEKLWNYEKFSSPKKVMNKYYYFKNNGLQNQNVLYVEETLGETPKVVLDPNLFSKDGTRSVAIHSFSNDGKYLAYGVANGGSDWRSIYIQNLETNQKTNDAVKWVKFSNIAWYKNGFFYSRYPATKDEEKLSKKNEFHQIFYHEVGTEQDEDELVFADRRHPKRNFNTKTTSDERFLILSGMESTSGNALYFKDLSKGELDFTPIVNTFEHDYSVVDNLEDNLVVLTNHKAPNNRLILINTSKPQPDFWQEIIPESEHVLKEVKIIGNKIIASYINNASSQIKIFSTKGEYESDIKLPSIGTVSDITGEKDASEMFFSFTSFTRPTTIYRYDVASRSTQIYKKPNLDFEPEDYETKQIVYKSYDGTKIPMFITYKKGTKLTGDNPTLLYGYGGFNISILPSFKVDKTILLESGGIYAVANIRGGGEFGKRWHKSGTLDKKQNVFNDFQSAAEYLIEKKYTSSEKLAIEGRSNGGLLVGACLTQRPDLYKVALPAVGVLDMLRYHKFTIGWAWASDYGTSEEPEQFDYLYAYSPLHNVVPKTSYPATLITTADHDDRVVPAHSYKFAAELQHKNIGDNPTLIRIDTSAGHGAGKPTVKRIEEAADILSFMLYNMGEEYSAK